MKKLNREEALIKYPWLKPYEYNPECLNPDTALMIDSIPEGWETFIWDMVEEINKCLIKNECIDDYELYQVKEKFGRLCWYDNQRCTYDIIRKYEDISWNTCVECGAHATYMSTGWIVPFCKECAEKNAENNKFFNYKEKKKDE